MTDPLGQSQIIPYLQGLSKYGYRFTILSFEKKSKFRKEQQNIREQLLTGNIEWKPLPFTRRPPLLSKLYDAIRMKWTAFSLQKKNNFSMVHCRSYIAADAGLALKKKYAIKFLFDMRGFWADEKVDNGQWNQNIFFYRIIYKYYKKKEKEYLLNADGIVSLTEAAKNYLLSITDYENLPITVIPCCADLDHFDYHKISSEEVIDLKNKLKIPLTAKIITYLGSSGGWYMMLEMFRFFNLLIKGHSEYVMLILTKENPDKIMEESLHVGIPAGKVFITYSDRVQVPEFLAMSTCGIFFIRNTFSKIASSPTKHAELMGMGIPVICNDIGDTGCIVNHTRTGIILNDYNDTSFLAAISKMDSLEKTDKEYIRKCAMKIFDLKIGVQKYLSEYNRILA